MQFFVGIYKPNHAGKFRRCMISVNRLRDRRSGFAVGDWLMDSGAFTEISTHGHYREPVDAYAEQVHRWSSNGNLLAAAAQDYMCEPFIVERTGLSVPRHQELSIERYAALRDLCPDSVIMPVLQGYEPAEYAAHVRGYGALLRPGAWVGVGSICKRNGSPSAIRAVLEAILTERPGLRLHGFGIKTTSLADAAVYDRLYSADSMAWSFAARYEGRDRHCWREAARFVRRIDRQAIQETLL